MRRDVLEGSGQALVAHEAAGAHGPWLVERFATSREPRQLRMVPAGGVSVPRGRVQEDGELDSGQERLEPHEVGHTPAAWMGTVLDQCN